jgi:hypothetical protein
VTGYVADGEAQRHTKSFSTGEHVAANDPAPCRDRVSGEADLARRREEANAKGAVGIGSVATNAVLE